jgi:tetratricopeptide (TPR) repeat protein
MSGLRFAQILRMLAVAASLGWLAIAAGCVGSFVARRATPLRISEIVDVGDSRRQGSMKLIIEGLDAEIRAPSERALSRYEQAIRIDPGNPFAYLALARHYVSAGDPQRALEHLSRAQSLFEPGGPLSPRIQPHLLGLRGGAFEEMGRRSEAMQLLAQARRLAPEVWEDGRLDAYELR